MAEESKELTGVQAEEATVVTETAAEAVAASAAEAEAETAAAEAVTAGAEAETAASEVVPEVKTDAAETAPAAEAEAKTETEAEAAPEMAASAETAAAPETKEEETPAPAAPTESMADYEEELSASLKQIHEGDVLTGTVIGVTEDEVTVDLKYYTEGVIRKEDYSADPTVNLKEAVKVGDVISATVVRRDGGQGQIMLSRKDAAHLQAWDKLRNLLETGENLTVKVAGVVKSGVIAYVEDIRGFIPASKLALSYVEDLNEWLGKQLEVRVITAEEEADKLVLSAREILREKEAEAKKARISNVQIGLVTEGTVESLQPYGAFINLGNGLSGLVHISQISTKRIKHPAEVLHVGDKVKVKVIAVKDGKLSLSMKALQDVMAEEIQEESVELPQSESLTTNLGSLFAKLKL